MLLATELEDIFLGTPIRVMLTDRSGRTFKLSASGTSSLDERLLKIPNGSILRFHQAIALGTDLSNIKYGLGVVGSVTQTEFSTNAYGAEVETSTTTFFIKVLSANFDPEITDISSLHFDLETPYGASSQGQLMYPNKFPTIFDIQNYFDGDDAEINNYINYVLDNSTGTKPHVQKNVPFNSRSILLSPVNAHKLDSVLNDISLLNNGSSTFTFQPDQQRAMFYIKKSPDYRNEYHFVALEPSSCKFLVDFKIVIDLTTKSTRGISIHNNSINAANFNIVLTECSLSGDNYEYYQVALWNSDRDYAFQMSDVHLFTDDVDSVYSFSAQPNLADQSLTFGDKDYVSLEDELERCDTYGNYVKQVTQPYKTKEIPDNVDLSSTTDPGYYFKNRNVDLIKSLPQEYDTTKGFVIFVFPKKKDDDEWVRYLLLNVDGDLFMGNSVVISREGIYDDDMYVDFDPNESYSIGSIVWYGSILYKFDVAHVARNPWNISEVHSTSVLNEIIESHPDNRSEDDIFIVRNDENEVYAYGWNDTFTDLESKYRVWTGENSELTSTYYYRREVVWRVVTQDKNMTTIHPHTDLAQLRVSGYYSGDGSQNLINCPTNTSFTMIVYPDGTNYLLVDSNNMAYTGRNVGSFEAPNIDWTNINNRYASSQLSSGADLTDLEGGPGLYYAASQGLNIRNAPQDVGYPFIYQILPNSLNESPLRLIYDSKNQVFLGQLMQGQDQTHTFKYIEWENVSDTDYIAQELSFGTDLYTVVEPGFYYSKQNSREQSTTQSNNSTSRTLIPPFTNIPDALRVRMENGNCYFSMLVSPTVQGGNISYTIIDDMGNTYFGARGELDPSTQSGVIHWNDVQTNIQATLLTSEDDLADRLNPGYYYAASTSLPHNSPVQRAFRMISLAGSQESSNILFAIDDRGQAYYGYKSDAIVWYTIPTALMTKFNSLSSASIDLFTNTELSKWSAAGTYIDTLQNTCTAAQLAALYNILHNITPDDLTHFSAAYTYINTLQSSPNGITAAKLKAFYNLMVVTNSVNQDKITSWTNAGTFIAALAAQNITSNSIITGKPKWDSAGNYIDTLQNTCTASKLAALYNILKDTTSDDLSHWNSAYNFTSTLITEFATVTAVKNLLKSVSDNATNWNSAYNFTSTLITEFTTVTAVKNLLKSVSDNATNWNSAYSFINSIKTTIGEVSVVNNLLTIVSNNYSNWNDANSKKHTHTDPTALNNVNSEKITQWNLAYTNNHTHTDLTALNSINSEKVTNWNLAYTNNHIHTNKAAIDTITDQKISNWDTAVSNASNALTTAQSAQSTAQSAQSTAQGIAGTASSALTTANSAYSIANEALNKQNDRKIILIDNNGDYIKVEDSSFTFYVKELDKQPLIIPTIIPNTTGNTKININIAKVETEVVNKNRSISFKFLVLPTSGGDQSVSTIAVSGQAISSGSIFYILKPRQFTVRATQAIEVEVVLNGINEQPSKMFATVNINTDSLFQLNQ